jgi:GrpB-like predicted nucleotidyltransferase (UPF0157 family)
MPMSCCLRAAGAWLLDLPAAADVGCTTGARAAQCQRQSLPGWPKSGRGCRRSALFVRHDRSVEWLTDAGLGLENNVLRLHRTSQAWVDAGELLRNNVAAQLVGLVVGVEQIGSSSVLGLLAKPIVDLAVGLSAEQDLPPASSTLQESGWIYRGDSGANGGHVFVLEARPQHRVAHIHVVEYGGEQWQDYLQLRDLLHRSSPARARYELVKRRLADELGDDREAYTDGKADIVSALLNDPD